MRFFSPPEKPTLSARFSMSWLICSLLADALDLFMKSGVESSSCPRLPALRVQSRLEKGQGRDAWNFDWILEREEKPLGGADIRLEV